MLDLNHIVSLYNYLDYHSNHWFVLNKSDLNNLKSTENIRNPWISNQLWMAHAVVTSEKNHFFNEKFSLYFGLPCIAIACDSFISAKLL